MKEHKERTNTKIDTNIDDIKAEESRSRNQTFSPLNSHNYNSSSNQPSDDVTQWPLLNSPGFHSHASYFTKRLSHLNLEGDTLL